MASGDGGAGGAIASYRRTAATFGDLTPLPLSQSTLPQRVQDSGSAVVTQAAAEAEAMVRAPSQADKVVWLGARTGQRDHECLQ